MKDSPKALTTISPFDGQNLSIVGDTYRIVISGKQTDNAYAVIDMLVPPGGGPGPHAHAGFQESFFVLEGEVEVKTELQTYIAKQGSFVNIPMGGIIHCFKNKSQSIARLWCVVVPSGLEEFFQEIGKPVDAGVFLPPPILNHDEVKQLIAIAEKHGQKIYPPDYLDKKQP